MTVSLTDMCGSDKCGDGEEWLNLIVGGGLWHIDDDVYDLLCIMEDHIDMNQGQLKAC